MSNEPTAAIPLFLRREAEASVALDGETQSFPQLTPAEIIERMGRPIVELPDGRRQCPVCGHAARLAAKDMGAHVAAHWDEAGVSGEVRPLSRDIVTCPVEGCGQVSRRSNLTGHMVTQHAYERAVATGVMRTHGFDLATMTTDRSSDTAPGRSAPRGNRQQPPLPVPVSCPFCEWSSNQFNGFANHLSKSHDVSDPVGRRELFEDACVEAGLEVPPRPKTFRDVAKAGRKVAVPARQAPTSPTRPSSLDAALAVVMSFSGETIRTETLPDVIAYIEQTRAMIERLDGAATDE